MKKGFTFLVLTLLLPSCSSNSIKEENMNSAYIDYPDIEFSKGKISLDKYNCSGSTGNTLLSINLNIANNSLDTIEYEIKNMEVVKESTGVSYAASFSYISLSKKISIGAELSTNLSFTATIPSDIKEEKYCFNLQLDHTKFKFYLYEMPDELRKTWTISYSLNNKIIQTQEVKDKKVIIDLYTYEDINHYEHCNKWYTENTFQVATTFKKSAKITNNLTLYGKIENNYQWLSTSGDIFAFLQKVSFIPSDKVLVIPSTYNGKEICISNYAIKDITTDKIYIPKTVHTIYTGNFQNINNAAIFYEGSADEWAKLFYMSSEIYTKNVTYNSKF